MNRKTFALVLLLAGMILLCVLFAHIDARNVVFCAGRGEHAAVTVKLNTYEEKIYPSYSESIKLRFCLCADQISHSVFKIIHIIIVFTGYYVALNANRHLISLIVIKALAFKPLATFWTSFI